MSTVYGAMLSMAVPATSSACLVEMTLSPMRANVFPWMLDCKPAVISAAEVARIEPTMFGVAFS